MKQKLIDVFRWIDPGRRSDQLVSDLSGWWRDPELLHWIARALAEPFVDRGVTVVLSPESRGFIVGPLVASALGAGFVEALKNVKGGDLADQVFSRNTPPDYRDRNLTLSVRARRLTTRDRVLVVDDWAETGGQISALARIIADVGAVQVGTAVVVDAMSSGTRHRLRARSILRIEELN
jgi:adenine phosphoribosyltransferase